MPEPEDETVEIDPELWEQWRATKLELDKLKAEADELAARIKKEAEAANATKVLVNGEHKGTVSSSVALRFDTTRFKRDWPDIYSQYQVSQKAVRLTMRKEEGNGGKSALD